MKNAILVFMESLSFAFQQGLVSKDKKNLLAAGFMTAVKQKDKNGAVALCSEMQAILERKEMAEVITMILEEGIA